MVTNGEIGLKIGFDHGDEGMIENGKELMFQTETSLAQRYAHHFLEVMLL